MIHIRPATPNDLPFIADIAAQAMLHDELFIHLCPHRHTYYADFRTAFLRRLKIRLYTPGYVMLVAVESKSESESGDHGARDRDRDERVRGYAVWSRRGDTPTATQWQKNGHGDGWWNDQYIQACATGYDFAAFPELWFLATVAVDPRHQRRGFGRSLVQWGLDRANEERIPVGLDASRQGLALYEDMGFRTVAMAEVVPGLEVTAMLWEPADIPA
ncbi:GNAT family acetyltransferase [Penicillium waksmanii]|uniref:GNAT family acetyltransferase n=1 Tax=Penicillium waksmanii TaxID=69791 RepID=UPI0025469D19|nr:GNAT family acetyltransferase [Penicillium waksmanii]KAJ5979813.1 GNAT family acetyltransferase [Penicillium waksmanii]